jgi:hypothetical protein
LLSTRSIVTSRSKFFNVTTLGPKNYKHDWNCSSTLAHRKDILEIRSKK